MFWAYGGLGDSSGMRHICSRGRCSLFDGDIGTSRITADQVRPATPANHSFLYWTTQHTDALLTPAYSRGYPVSNIVAISFFFRKLSQRNESNTSYLKIYSEYISIRIYISTQFQLE